MGSKQRLLLRRILGGDLEPGVGDLLLTLGLAVTAQYAFWAFFAVWAIEELGMSKGDIGLAFLAAAVLGIAGGLLGGVASDRLGRRPVILAGAAAQAALPTLLLVPGLPAAGAVAVLGLLTFSQPVRWAAQSALLADLVPEERRESAFGSVRVAFNTGAVGGPLLGAALVAVGWTALHAGVVVLFALSLATALRLPALPPAERAGGPRPSLRLLLVSPVFATFFAAALFASMTYNAFETLMPVSLTQEHGYPAAAWGVLFVVNPVLVILFQLRVTRWTAGVPAGPKLAAALLLMGCSFLPLAFTAWAPVLVLLLAVFVAGEMLWAPTADALAARLAPPDARGATMGTLGIAMWMGGALAPAAGFRVADSAGDAAMWVAIAVVAACAAALYWAAARAGEGRAPAPAAEALETA
jgi:predicted MFS family arabinose efflux permease